MIFCTAYHYLQQHKTGVSLSTAMVSLALAINLALHDIGLSTAEQAVAVAATGSLAVATAWYGIRRAMQNRAESEKKQPLLP